MAITSRMSKRDRLSLACNDLLLMVDTLVKGYTPCKLALPRMV